LKFDFDTLQKRYKKIIRITETNLLSKSSTEGGKIMEDLKLEISKFHRYIDIKDFEKFEKILIDKENDTLEEANRITYQDRANLKDSDFAVIARVKDKTTGEMKKIRKFLILDEAHATNALARLEQPASQSIFKKLGISISLAKRRILKRVKQLKKTKLSKKKEIASFDCECIECGYKMSSPAVHCKDIKCAKCGGQMRRAERPGVGQPGKIKASEDSKIHSDALREGIRKTVRLLIESSKNFKQQLDIATYKIEDARKGNSDALRDLRKAKKEVEFHKVNASKVYERRQKLGDYGKEVIDVDILKDEIYEKELAKKLEIETSKDAKLHTAQDNVGDERKGNDYYKQLHKDINKIAFPEPKEEN